MLKKLITTFLIFIVLFLLDQYIKYIFVDGFVNHWECISLVLAYNKGVAFSMFAFLAEYLKYIQLVILGSGIIYLILNKKVFEDYYIAISLLLAGGLSNIYDRFNYEGVVDYIYWHCWFDFAIFNLADILINLSVLSMIIINYRLNKKSTKIN